jgi:hypothetical protein
MNAVEMPIFEPAPWLPNGHFQTVYASLLMPVPLPDYKREILTLPDGDIIAADWIEGQLDKPLLVLIHGMEGDSQSNYARLLMNQCRSLGWRGVVLHMRSCGGFMNRKPQFYHAGFYSDIEFFIDEVLATRSPSEKIYLAGISLGGSQVVHYLAKGLAKERVTSAAIVSTPLDLQGSADFMSAGLNRIYVLKFRNSLLKKYRAKADLIQNPKMESDLARSKTFWDLDNAATAPSHGFRDAAHYYSEMSAKKVLQDLQVPAVYLASRDDPFIPEDSMPSTGMHFEKLQSHLTDFGGHVGFVDRQHKSWMVQAVFKYFNNFESSDS